jgi:adenylate cyclase
MAPAKKSKVRVETRWLLLLPLAFAWCVMNHLGALDFVENKLIDLRFRFRGERASPVKLIYVDIDNDAIQTFHWPWKLTRFAEVLDALFKYGHVKAVGIDVVFSDNARAEYGMVEQKEGRVALGKAIYTHRRVVLAANYVPGVGTLQAQRQFPWEFDGFTDPDKNDLPESPGFPIFHPTYGIVGLIDTYHGDTRAAPMFARTSAGTFYPMALQLALLNWGLNQTAINIFPDRTEIRRPNGEVVATIPMRRGQLVEVTWFSRWQSLEFNPRCSVKYITVYKELREKGPPERQPETEEFFSQFKDAIVLIGPVDPLLQDLARTPFDPDPVPQVGFHGNLLKTMISGDYLHHIPDWAGDVITLVVTLVVVGLALTGGPKGIPFKILAMVLLAAYVALGFFIFKTGLLILPITAPLGAAITTSLGAVAWQLVEEQKAKGRIKGMFGTYLSPMVVNQMIESGKDPELGGHDAEITAYFSDIQKFSSFSEVLPSAKLAELLNEFLTASTDIVQAEMGTLDKYIGDAVVAMFGAPVDAPDHAFRACVASQLVQLRVAELREKWRSEGDKWPQLVHNLRTRIGLNTGQCMIGNMGSRTRFNYTMMGDNVNLAARMESGAKSWGAYTMCTESTKLACLKTNTDRVVFRSLAKVVVQGRSQAVPVHEILGLKENVSDQTGECIAIFEQALAKYYARDWDGATALFRKSAELEPNQPGKAAGVSTNPSLVYLPIIEDAKDEPPPIDWDGRYVMKEK